MVAKKTVASLVSLVLFIVIRAQEPGGFPTPLLPADSMVAAASTQYQSYSFLRNFFMGKNYRREWQLPVKLPVFRLSLSGFTVKELGGGMQTKSLRLTDGAGKEWALRTIDKDVREAVPPPLRNTLAQRATQDLISAAFPYAAPVAGVLANALGLPAATPQTFFVAADTALGEMNAIFANTICSLEERDPGFTQTDNTQTVLKNLQSDNRFKIQQPLLLKARLLDMLMGDWDRHADNWRWGVKDSAGHLFYYPVPRDRDWAFYNSGGLLPKILQLTGGLRHLVSFKAPLKNSKDLSWKAWTLDKTFLNELAGADWERIIREVQSLLTDSVIKAAVGTMPAAVYQLDGNRFINTLKKRRDDLTTEAMKYYRFTAVHVLINGSDAAEQFVFSASPNGLQLTVFNAANEKIFERIFSNETAFITLNAHGGNDSITTGKDVQSKIKISCRGGSGADSYNLQGGVRTKVYDVRSDGNNIVNNRGSTFYFY